MEQRQHHLKPHPQPPHVLLLPFPAQGHVKPMFKLAQLLSHARFHVTFVTSDYALHGLLKSLNLEGFLARFPGFQFHSLPEGPAPFSHNEQPGSVVASLIEIFSTPRILARKQLFREVMMALGNKAVPPTCIIADGIMSFAIDVAEELGIPAITFRTYSASCTWVYFHIHELVQLGEIPFPDEDMDRPIPAVTGLENLLRRRDLPSICRVNNIDDPLLEFYLTQTSSMTRASSLILNTFQELEEAGISGLGSVFPPKKIYTIGPLHALLQERLADSLSASSDGSLQEQDRSCMAWLDCKPPGSVVYVSFGSLVRLTPEQLMEFRYGLINSGVPFLWVIRPDLIEGGEHEMVQKPELLEETKRRGMIVGWAPQEEVLSHPSIGGFLTHGGWNSTLESIFAGVPLIGWPQVADQQVNTRCISDLWRVGIDMKDTCERSTVERMVRDLIQNKELARCSDVMAKLARKSIRKGGSSYLSLETLIEDIRAIGL